MRLSSYSSSCSFSDVLHNPNSSLEDALSSKYFTNRWLNQNETLCTFIINHYNELIEIGFQIKSESIFSIRCLQIMGSFNQNFRNRLFNETNFLQFVYNYIFNISTYPYYSQKNYFYVLPNIMLDQLNRLHPIFDVSYFKELSAHIDNDFAYNFLLRAITLAPFTVTRVIKKIELEKTIILNFLVRNQKEADKMKTKLLLIRSQSIFKEIVGTKMEGNSSNILFDNIDAIIQDAIDSPNAETFSFIQFVDEYSMKKFSFSKWKKVHLKIVPYMSTFCRLITKSNSKIFTSLSHSITMLAISVTSTTKNVNSNFIELFHFLITLFFESKTNTFLHNICVKAFNLLLSLDQINSSFLDELDLFRKVTDCYEKVDVEYYNSFFGQLRIISELMAKFVVNSKTVDSEKWNKYVVAKNTEFDNLIDKRYGGNVPINMNPIKLPFYELLNSPSFVSKNLLITERPPRKNSSPLS